MVKDRYYLSSDVPTISVGHETLQGAMDEGLKIFRDFRAIEQIKIKRNGLPVTEMVRGRWPHKK